MKLNFDTGRYSCHGSIPPRIHRRPSVLPKHKTHIGGGGENNWVELSGQCEKTAMIRITYGNILYKRCVYAHVPKYDYLRSQNVSENIPN